MGMKWLSAGLTFVNAAAVCGLLTGMAARGLGKSSAIFSIAIGLVAAAVAYWVTVADAPSAPKPSELPTPPDSAGRRSRMRALLARVEPVVVPPRERYRSIWLWLLIGCFAIFAVRSFVWLLYFDNNELKVQSPNNLGDLSLHLTYIKTFASGVPLWPDNPIYVFSKLRYPAGIDLFNALLSCLGVDIIRGLVWTGLLASIATCYALYRWAGSFGIAAFLFNGGVASYQFFQTYSFQDYQGNPTIAWKSIPLAMFVTQRGLLYALPAGLLLLYQWRAQFFPESTSPSPSSDPETTVSRKHPLPFWLELSLYATMPLFHVHTFIVLTIVLVFFFLFGNGAVGKRLIFLVGGALIPATFCVWVISDNFHASSVMEWKPGWVQQQGEFAMSFLQFWLVNFGAWIPLVAFFIGITAVSTWKSYEASGFKMPIGLAFLVPAIATLLLGYLVKVALWQAHHSGIAIWLYFVIVPLPIVIGLTALLAWQQYQSSDFKLAATVAFLLPAIAIFLLGYLVKTAPWEWDNIKIIVWAYFIILPFLWNDLISHWPLPLRAVVCVALFASGFITLFGGLAAGKEGFGLIDRGELDAVGITVRKLPANARFLGFPTFNHPVLLQGRMMVLGYPGHLWTQGFNYSAEFDKLTSLMKGEAGWKTKAHSLQARYLFWGREEKVAYPESRRPWEAESKLIAAGSWGAIYDLESPNDPRLSKPAPSPSQ
ncbi:MAG: hypothetical protein V7609_2064 [Verrucomicrobiota bacterium]